MGMVAFCDDQRGLAFAHLWETVFVVIMMVTATALTSIAVPNIGKQEVERSLNDQRAAYAEFAVAQISTHLADNFKAEYWLGQDMIEEVENLANMMQDATLFGCFAPDVDLEGAVNWVTDQDEQLADMADFLESIEPAGYNARLEIWKPSDTQFSFDLIEGFDTAHASKLAEASTGNFRAGAPQYRAVAMRNGLVYTLILAEEE